MYCPSDILNEAVSALIDSMIDGNKDRYFRLIEELRSCYSGGISFIDWLDSKLGEYADAHERHGNHQIASVIRSQIIAGQLETAAA